METAIGISIAL